ncbi:hypothetical protein QKU48_gp0887 [Fadolivirus algeromassiliense]|jgi:hypothetical protein|uniref:Uncharacterized protein n=1 Tax=Fadolivirus FV1/VV64 TaxID=3070911 RepID=A0A7D3QUQ4_9VIRU|nr:hypothetical protein QKU48_gp0887 [Fadolivirus algeromassiliense]QKF94345.1 hypothetical protein Fadolivirus_1_887 [Fadolivirus FV1/VV64]
MDINAWIDKINSININDNLRNNLITFFKNFHSVYSLSLIEITDTDMVNAFNNINNYKPLSICLDIEFQSTIISKKDMDKYTYNNNSNNDPTARFIREIGMMFFIKESSTKWYYIGSIFVNFNSLDKYGFKLDDLKLIGTKYSTVNDLTFNQMLKNENYLTVENLITPLQDDFLFRSKKDYKSKIYHTIKLLKSNYLFNNFLTDKIKDKVINILHNILTFDDFSDVTKELKYIKKQLHNIQHELYGRYLDKVLLKSLINTHKLYWNDDLVLERIKLTYKKENIFFETLEHLVNDAVLIVKGKMDLIAINNMALMLTENKLLIENYYDIETFNGFSQLMYKSAQLEETYNNMIKSNIYAQKAKELFDRIGVTIGDKAHNPLVDSLFTIIIAVIVNLGLNKYFKELDENQYGGNYYHKYYISLKNKYLQLKNK